MGKRWAGPQPLLRSSNRVVDLTRQVDKLNGLTADVYTFWGLRTTMNALSRSIRTAGLLCFAAIATHPAIVAAADPPRPVVKVVEGGESELKPEDVLTTVLGPRVNQPDRYPGYGGFVGWVSPIRVRNGDWVLGFSAGYWHASAPTPLRFSPGTIAEYQKMGLTEVPAEHQRGWGGEQFDAAELPNGDLLCVFRRSEPDKTGNEVRWQGVLKQSGDMWTPGEVQPAPFPHSGHPDVLATREGAVLLYVATSGIHWTTDAGKTWHKLEVPGTAYYPRAVQAADGRIFVLEHVGGDDAYWSKAEQLDLLGREPPYPSFEPNSFTALSRRIRRLSASDKSAWSIRARCMAVLYSGVSVPNRTRSAPIS